MNCISLCKGCRNFGILLLRRRVTAATAMEAAMKASDSDEGDGEGDSGGGRATVTRVEGKGQWRGRQERSRRQKEGDGVKEGDAEGG
jgi:hypothetical protein